MLVQRKWVWLLAIILGWCIVNPCSITAHGVISNFLGTGALVVEAHYSDGEPMNYAEVTVHAPQQKIPFQSGYTDANGHFAFCPNVVGNWKIIFQDGMGHRSELELTVETIPSPTAQAPAASSPLAKGPSAPFSPQANIFWQLPLYLRILIGISLIFGISGFLILLRSRHKPEG